MRAHLVVPLRQGRAGQPPQLRHLLVADLDALGVRPGYPRGGDLQPVAVVVVRLEFRIVSKLSSGRAAQLRQMKLNRRCSVGFHWLQPLGSWATVTRSCLNSDCFVRVGSHCSCRTAGTFLTHIRWQLGRGTEPQFLSRCIGCT